MPWWIWTILGVIAWIIVLLFAYAFCKAAGDEDTRRGYK
jgi:hypothetical protein